MIDGLGQAAERIAPKPKNFFSRFRRPQSEPSEFPISSYTLVFETLGYSLVWAIVLAIGGKGLRFSAGWFISLSLIALVAFVVCRARRRAIELILQLSIAFVLAIGIIQLIKP
jgi:hypothetical protein